MVKHKKKDEGGAENIKVLVRCRPLNTKETDAGMKSAVDLDLAAGTVTVHHMCSAQDRWTFDAVVNNTCSQRDIFVQFVQPMVDSVLEGFNATIFAYGQSGSGKTHTMTGPVPAREETQGVIPRSFVYIFDHIRERKKATAAYHVTCSFLELYNGKIRDLLAKQQTSLQIKENKDKTFFVNGLTQPDIKSEQDLLHYMEEGNVRRQVAATELNTDSSRSHSIFSVLIQTVETHEDGECSTVTSKLNLVDLAGSERQSKTRASGDTLKEGCNINLSLSTLGTVIDTIVKGKGHVPFRSSPLTMLLKDSLGGNSKTCMFANINSADSNVSETVSTLRFADRAKQIKNKPVVQKDAKDQKIQDLLAQVHELQEKLAKHAAGDAPDYEAANERLEEQVSELQALLATARQDFDDQQLENKAELLAIQKQLSDTAAGLQDHEDTIRDLHGSIQVMRTAFSEERSLVSEFVDTVLSFIREAAADDSPSSIAAAFSRAPGSDGQPAVTSRGVDAVRMALDSIQRRATDTSGACITEEELAAEREGFQAELASTRLLNSRLQKMHEGAASEGAALAARLEDLKQKYSASKSSLKKAAVEHRRQLAALKHAQAGDGAADTRKKERPAEDKKRAASPPDRDSRRAGTPPPDAAIAANRSPPDAEGSLADLRRRLAEPQSDDSAAVLRLKEETRRLGEDWSTAARERAEFAAKVEELQEALLRAIAPDGAPAQAAASLPLPAAADPGPASSGVPDAVQPRENSRAASPVELTSLPGAPTADELQRWKAEIDRLRDEREEAVDELEQAAADKRELLAERDRHRAEYADVLNDCTTFASETNQLRDEQKKAAARAALLEEAVQQAAREREAAQQALERLEKRHEERAEALSQMRTVHAHQSEVIERHRALEAELRQQLGSLQQSSDEQEAAWDGRLAAEQQKWAAYTSKRLEDAAAQHEDALARRESDAAALRKKVKKSQLTVQRVKEKYDKQVHESAELRARVEELQEEALRRQRSAENRQVDESREEINNIIRSSKAANLRGLDPPEGGGPVSRAKWRADTDSAKERKTAAQKKFEAAASATAVEAASDAALTRISTAAQQFFERERAERDTRRGSITSPPSRRSSGASTGPSKPTPPTPPDGSDSAYTNTFSQPPQPQAFSQRPAENADLGPGASAVGRHALLTRAKSLSVTSDTESSPLFPRTSSLVNPAQHPPAHGRSHDEPPDARRNVSVPPEKRLG
ncbi:Kinesin-like protein FLA10 [Diplonema papillatum]|nr:Kinesin-like protein FLA10 [Diplonema papillatum]